MTRKFKTNTAQDRHRGLTYDFMREYISTHEEDAKVVLAELEEMIFISKGHSLSMRYPTIKAWFLERYPSYAKFGMPKSENISQLPAVVEEDSLPEAVNA